MWKQISEITKYMFLTLSRIQSSIKDMHQKHDPSMLLWPSKHGELYKKLTSTGWQQTYKTNMASLSLCYMPRLWLKDLRETAKSDRHYIHIIHCWQGQVWNSIQLYHVLFSDVLQSRMRGEVNDQALNTQNCPIKSIKNNVFDVKLEKQHIKCMKKQDLRVLESFS